MSRVQHLEVREDDADQRTRRQPGVPDGESLHAVAQLEPLPDRVQEREHLAGGEGRTDLSRG